MINQIRAFLLERGWRCRAARLALAARWVTTHSRNALRCTVAPEGPTCGWSRFAKMTRNRAARCLAVAASLIPHVASALPARKWSPLPAW